MPSCEDLSHYLQLVVPKQTHDLSATTSTINNVCTKSLFLIPTTYLEVENVLSTIKAKRSEDIYGITTLTLKQVATYISKPLAEIFNRAMQQGVFPDKLKIARITPVLKKGDAKDCKNYRPISVLPAFSKVLEELILRRLNTHLANNNILAKEQFAYQMGKGTEDAMKDLMAEICKALDGRRKCLAQLCDLSRAFDSMPHQKLLKKLEQYGIRGVPLSLIRSYLTNRLQRVQIHTTVSTLRETTIGVPQGSLLGGILFIIYMNDLPYRMDAKTIIYADDTTLLSTAETNENLQEEAAHHMSQAKEWFTENLLHLNEAKTKQIAFQMDRWENPGEPVQFLGICIDPRLTWNDHVDQLCKTLSKATYAIRRTEKTAGYCAARVAYLSLFHTRMSYGIETWGHGAHTMRILILQKRAIRSLTGEVPRTQAKPLFQKHKLLTVYAVYILRTLCTVHKSVGQIPKQTDHHSYATRAGTNLRPDFSRLTTTAHYTRPVRMYNSLPKEWKSQAPKAFRRTLKEHLLCLPPYGIEEFMSTIII